MKFADQTGITELITLTKTALKPLEAFKNSVTNVNGIVKSNGSGGFSAAVAGTDYAAASHTHTTKQIEGLSSAIAKAEPFVVEMTTGSGDVTINKSFSEIKAAFDAGRICYARESKHGIILSLVGFFSYGGVIKATFVISSLSNVTVTPHAAIEALFVAEDNSINTRSVTLQPQIKATGLLKGSGDGNITAAVAGTDYAAANHTHDYLPLSGGTLTGNLTGKYITGTWLQTTVTGDKAGNFATIDGDGWIYYRTPAETLADIGAAAASHNHSASNITSGTISITRGGTGATNASSALSNLGAVPKSGGTMTGPLVAQTNTSYTTAQMRNIIISTADPSGGNNGDIWLKYKA